MLRDAEPNGNLAHRKCPNCGCRGNFAPHGRYSRHLVCPDGELVITIERVRCMSCRATHALIPPDVVPYRIHCATLIATIAMDWARGRSNARIERKLAIAPSTRRRLLSAAICDLCMAFKAPPLREQMAQALEGIEAPGLPALCLRELSHAISEHVRSPNLHPRGMSRPAHFT